jgi:hypothetical protein
MLVYRSRPAIPSSPTRPDSFSTLKLYFTIVILFLQIEASDPIIADTTRLVLDFKTPEPATPMTPPTDATDKFSFASPPAVHKVPEISKSGNFSVKFFIRASTTAQRSVHFSCDYSVENSGKTFRCFLSETLHLETVEPFVVDSELLSVPRQLGTRGSVSGQKIVPGFVSTFRILHGTGLGGQRVLSAHGSQERSHQGSGDSFSHRSLM